MITYDINTLQELKDRLKEVREYDPEAYKLYTIQEIVESYPDINPAILDNIDWTMIEV